MAEAQQGEGNEQGAAMARCGNPGTHSGETPGGSVETSPVMANRVLRSKLAIDSPVI
jgi:hypothetical protein